MNRTTTGTTTPTLPGGSTSGNLLVACLQSRAGGTAFTGPAGWTQGPTAAHGTVARSEIWYYLANPGGISSAAFVSGTGEVEGCLSEYVPPGTVTLDTTGNANLASGITLSVTASAANAAGDLAVCAFGVHYSTGVSITWTDPTGFTLIDSEQATGSDHCYGGYDLNVAAGTLTVVGTVSSNTNMTGFAGVIATFTAAAAAALAPPPVVIPQAVQRAANW